MAARKQPGPPRETVKLKDLYSRRQLRDKSERLHQYLCPGLLAARFEVRRMSVRGLKRLMANPLDTVFEAFEEYATEEQEELIAAKVANFDAARIIVVAGDYLIDGNHHVIAAIRSRAPARYVNLRDVPSSPLQRTTHQQHGKKTL